MQNNQTYGITVEDLEKAASVRLFEKAAAAEGINLNELSESQLDDLYSNYQQLSEETTMNDELIDLFEKQAAYEGVDLEALNDEELAYVYNNFITNLAEEADEDYDDEYYDEDDYDAEEEAYEKLAEAEILGRHMARAYMDELYKEAKESPEDMKTYKDAAEAKMKSARDSKKLETGKIKKKSFGETLKELATGHEAAEQRALGKVKDMKRSAVATDRRGIAKAKKVNKENFEAALKKARRTERMKGYGKRGLVAGAVGAAGYGAKKLMEKEAANEAIYNLAYERAEEFLKEGSIYDYDGSTIDNLAIEVLEQHGYEID